MKKIAVPAGIFIVLNLLLIFMLTQFFYEFSGEVLFAAGRIILGLGLAGLAIVVICTSKLKAVLKGVFTVLILVVCGFFGYNYFAASETVIERYYAVVITEIADEVHFTEYWFPNPTELNRFLSQVTWYQNAGARRDMLSYYQMIKEEEAETDEEAIERKYLRAAPPARLTSGALVAYVNEYRSGFFTIAGKPEYHIRLEGKP